MAQSGWPPLSASRKGWRAIFQKCGNALAEIIRDIDGLDRGARDSRVFGRPFRQDLADEVFQHREHERGVGGNLACKFARGFNLLACWHNAVDEPSFVSALRID